MPNWKERHDQLLKELIDGEAHVSHSQISKYANCPKSWWYYMVAKLQLNRIDTIVGKRTLGKLIHMGLDFVIRSSLPEQEVNKDYTLHDVYTNWLSEEIKNYDGILPEEQDLLYDLMFQAQAIVPKVVREIKKLSNGNWETLHDKDGVPIIEYELYSTIYGVKMLSYIDWAVIDKESGKVFIIDFKTTGRKKNNYDMDVQVSSIYNIALRQNNLISEHGEAIILEVDAKELKRPSLNKDGSMSKAMLHTTWEIYEEELRANDLDPDDYLDMRRKLMNIEFVKVHRILRTELEAYNIWGNRGQIVRQIMEALDTIDGTIEKFPANLNNPLCNSCEYLEACKEDIAGFGFQELVDSGIYIIREEKPNEIEELDLSNEEENK